MRRTSGLPATWPARTGTGGGIASHFFYNRSLLDYRLGQLLEKQGKRKAAAARYRTTLKRWTEAEPDLPEGTAHLHGDRDRLGERAAALRELAPDVVLDVVPYTQAHAGALVDVFSGVTGRVVALSSSDVYRNYDGFRGESDHPPDPAPLDEDAPLRETRFPYRGYEGLDFAYAEDYDKILVEETLRSAPDLPATILRLPAVYGPGDRQYRFFPYLQRMFDERPAILLDEAEARFRWTHGYVENVAAAIARAVTDERAAGQTFNVGERQTPIIKERVEHLAGVVGWTGKIVTLPQEQLPEALRTPFDYRYSLATDTRRLRDALDFTDPADEAEALHRTVAWERQHSPENEAFDYATEDAALRRAT